MILLFTALASAQDALDEDADGLSALEERHYRTDPHDADSDSDGMLDGVEVWMGLDPMRPDTDGDGCPDGMEITRGTDPRVFNDAPPPPPVAIAAEVVPVVAEQPTIVQAIAPQVTVRAAHATGRSGGGLPAVLALLLLSALPLFAVLRLFTGNSDLLRALNGVLRAGLQAVSERG